MKRLIFVCLVSIFVSIVSQAQVTIIGHRGASFLAPENTLASMNLAWELNADAVEIDIHLSKDNRIMVHHDSNTKRQTAVDCNIKNTNSDELRTLDAGVFKNEKFRGEKIPFLEEVIATIPVGKILVVEIKCGREVLPFLKNIVDASDKKRQIEFISFGWKTIIEAKKLFPENKCYWLSEKEAVVKHKIKNVARKGLDGLDLYSEIINRELVAKTKDLGLEMLCWTVDDKYEAQRLISLGVIGITTNRPAWLKEQLAK